MTDVFIRSMCQLSPFEWTSGRRISSIARPGVTTIKLYFVSDGRTKMHWSFLLYSSSKAKVKWGHQNGTPRCSVINLPFRQPFHL